MKYYISAKIKAGFEDAVLLALVIENLKAGNQQATE
jgi:hypothetical protein